MGIGDHQGGLENTCTYPRFSRETTNMVPLVCTILGVAGSMCTLLVKIGADLVAKDPWGEAIRGKVMRT